MVCHGDVLIDLYTSNRSELSVVKSRPEKAGLCVQYCGRCIKCCDVFWCVLVGGVSVCFVRGGVLCNGESDSWQPGPGLPGYGRHCSYTATCYITLAPC